MRRSILIAFTVALVAMGCSGAKGDSADRLQVFAAASLAEVLPRLDDDPSYQFAGSDELALQIREGARADVYAAASPSHPLHLFEEGLVREPAVFATNELVLIVPSGNPAGIGSIGDLRDPDVRLVIGAQGVPVGDYTRLVLEKLNATDILERVASEEQDVKGVVGKVALGEADAGFVYATDVTPVKDDVVAIPLPQEAQPSVEYMVAVIADSERIAEAEAFVALLLGAHGRAAMREAGFGLP